MIHLWILSLRPFQREIWESFKQEETFWRQKSRIKWLAEWDKNTNVFHQTVNTNYYKSLTTRLVLGKIKLRELTILALLLLISFHSLIFGSSWKLGIPILFIPNLISWPDCEFLIAHSFHYWADSIVFWMGSYDAPGLDGFSVIFYNVHWHTILPDLLTIVHHFFKTGWIPSSVNSTIISYSKEDNSKFFSYFRPISLYT